MAEYGEWNRKGASLSDKTAKKEYGVSRDFIVKGIRAGRFEYRCPLCSNRKLKINGKEKENSCKGSNVDRCKETVSSF